MWCGVSNESLCNVVKVSKFVVVQSDVSTVEYHGADIAVRFEDGRKFMSAT